MYTQTAIENRYDQDRQFGDVHTDLPLRILIIDDNKDFACSLSSLFKHLGYKSCTAYDKKSGMQRVLEIRPDLIFCDIGLPGRGCYEIADEIRSEQSTRHVILAAVTCYSHEKVKLLVKELGFDFYISKPIQTSILDDLLQKVQIRKTNLNRKTCLTAV